MSEKAFVVEPRQNTGFWELGSQEVALFHRILGLAVRAEEGSGGAYFSSMPKAGAKFIGKSYYFKGVPDHLASTGLLHM